jgi:hypothetical protein
LDLCPIPKIYYYVYVNINFLKILNLKYFWELGIVAHICNSSYLGGRDWEDEGLRAAQAKKVSETQSQ